jgi:predicted enzyme related to lactoylglutathione lyase
MKRQSLLSSIALLALVPFLAPGCANNPKTQSAGALVEALGATALYSPDPARLADWYGTRFRIGFRHEGAGYISKDDTNLGSILIAINPAPAGAKERPIDVFFFVRNLDRVLGQLSDLGTSPLRLETDEYARPKAIVLDPDGNRIELVQR